MSLRTEPLPEQATPAGIKVDDLRQAISREYEEVAKTPKKGFYFHTWRRLTEIVEYRQEWLERIPKSVIDSFAGTGNPFAIGEIASGE